MQKLVLLISIVSLSASAALAAQPPDISGKWNIHNDIGGSESDMTCTFVQKRTDLSGTCKSEEKSYTIAGTVNDTKLMFKYGSEYNGTPLTLVYTATIDGMAKIAGAVEVEPLGVTGEFAATPLK